MWFNPPQIYVFFSNRLAFEIFRHFLLIMSDKTITFVRILNYKL